MKRTPLKRKTPLRAKRGFVRVPLSRNGHRSAGWTRSRRWCFDRAGDRCEVRRAEGCTGRAEHAHHIRLRSQGGSDDPANLLAVCHACHEWVHKNRDEARKHGWIIDSKSDAA